MNIGELLYEGKAKKVYLTDDADQVVVDYKDDATAFNGVKKGTITGKGVVNNKMSNFLFGYLEKNGVPTHFIKEIDDRKTLVKKVRIVPLEVIIRNIAAGSFSKRYGVAEGTALLNPTLEFSYKKDELNDPLLNETHALALGLATKDEIDRISAMSYKINDLLTAFFKSVGVTLVDFKLEFGKYKDQIVLADEISPDTCRFWDAATGVKLDKDRFRFDLGDVDSGYKELWKRLGLH